MQAGLRVERQSIFLWPCLSLPGLELPVREAGAEGMLLGVDAGDTVYRHPLIRAIGNAG